MTLIFKYTFEDGTILKLLDIGFSLEELWMLQELHGNYKMEAIRR